eukprot:7316535-Alexandrium_andersonii.AAC.1
MRTVVRRAGAGIEFLTQRAFLKTTAASGAPVVSCLIRDPVPVNKGKTAWHEFGALCSFFPM